MHSMHSHAVCEYASLSSEESNEICLVVAPLYVLCECESVSPQESNKADCIQRQLHLCYVMYLIQLHHIAQKPTDYACTSP